MFSKNYLIINEDIKWNKDILLGYYKDNNNMQLINMFEMVQLKNQHNVAKSWLKINRIDLLLKNVLWLWIVVSYYIKETKLKDF